MRQQGLDERERKSEREELPLQADHCALTLYEGVHEEGETDATRTGATERPRFITPTTPRICVSHADTSTCNIGISEAKWCEFDIYQPDTFTTHLRLENSDKR